MSMRSKQSAAKDSVSRDTECKLRITKAASVASADAFLTNR
ncbi:hypothetical protein [Stieleria neptunia]|nr:hypothetical protein [Stieleria neptunia]